jgi:hypothetical protein
VPSSSNKGLNIPEFLSRNQEFAKKHKDILLEQKNIYKFDVEFISNDR